MVGLDSYLKLNLRNFHDPPRKDRNEMNVSKVVKESQLVDTKLNHAVFKLKISGKYAIG